MLPTASVSLAMGSPSPVNDSDKSFIELVFYGAGNWEGSNEVGRDGGLCECMPSQDGSQKNMYLQLR